MSDISNLSDVCRKCENCKRSISEVPIRRFGILQNCEDTFCYSCTLGFWKEEKYSDTESEFYLLCPVCDIKSYSVAASSQWFEKPEDKKAYLDKYFESIKDLTCEFCLRGNGNCMHGKKYNFDLDIAETKPLSAFKFENITYPLHSPNVLDCSPDGKVPSTHGSCKTSWDFSMWQNSDLSSSQSVQFKNPLTKGNETTSETDSSKAGIFSEKDFPPLRNSKTILTKTAPSEDKPKKSLVDLSTDVLHKSKPAKNLIKHEPILSLPIIHLPSEYNNPLPPVYELEKRDSPSYLPKENLPENPVDLSKRYQKSMIEGELSKYFSKLLCENPYNDSRLSYDIPPVLSGILHVDAANENVSQPMKVGSSSSNKELKTKRGDAVLNRGDFQAQSSVSNNSNRIVPLIDWNRKLAPNFQDHAWEISESSYPQASNRNQDIKYCNWLKGCNPEQYVTIRNYLNKMHTFRIFQRFPGNVIYPTSEIIYDLSKISGNTIDINRSLWPDNVSKHEESIQPGLEIAPMNTGFNLQSDSTRNNRTLNQYPIVQKHDAARYSEIPFREEIKQNKRTASENYIQIEPSLCERLQSNREKQRENSFRNSPSLNQIQLSYPNFSNFNPYHVNPPNLHENLNPFHQMPPQSLGEIPVPYNNQIQIPPYNPFPGNVFWQVPMEQNFQIENNYFEMQNPYTEPHANYYPQVHVNYPYTGQINLGNQVHANVQGLLEASAYPPNLDQAVRQSSNLEQTSARQARRFDVSDKNTEKTVKKRN